MIIGLTGGIGSGKTTVAKVFEAMGGELYNSDERAKELYFNTEIKKQVVALLGAEAYVNNHTLNKDWIAKQIFSNADLLTQLNAIIHPAVKGDFEAFKQSLSPDKIIIKETALLFEANLQQQVDVSVLVTAPLALKIQRVMHRNNLNEQEIEKRLANQWTDEQKTPLANFIINNDGKNAIIPQVVACLKNIKD